MQRRQGRLLLLAVFVLVSGLVRPGPTVGQGAAAGGKKPAPIPSHPADAAKKPPTDAPSEQKKKPATNPEIKLVGDSTLPLDPACNACETATKDLKFELSGPNPLPLDLSVSTLVNEANNEEANAAVSIEVRGRQSLDNDCSNRLKPLKELAVLPGEEVNTLTHKAPKHCADDTVVLAAFHVKGILGPGKWKATIKNRGADVGAVEVINPAVPMKIKLVTLDTANPRITVTRGKHSSFTLQNDDTAGVLVTWTLSSGGKVYPSPVPAADMCKKDKDHAELGPATEKLPAGGSHEVFFKLPKNEGWFPGWIMGILKPETNDAKLTVRLASTSCAMDKGAGAPTVTFPLKVQFNRYTDNVQKGWSYVIVFCIVFFGGMCSLYVNFAFPFRTKRLGLRSQLSDAQTAIAGLPVEVASRLRVLAGMERRSLSEKVGTLEWYEPTSDDLLTRITSSIQTLNSRIDAISKLGDYRRRFDNIQAQSVPPSLLAEIDILFEMTVELLNKLSLTADDFKTVSAKLSDIEGLLSNWKQQIPARALQLQSRLTQLAAKLLLPVSDNTHLGRMRQRFPQLFARLNDIQKTTPPIVIDESNFLELDTLAFRLGLITDYVAACDLRDASNFDATEVAAFRDRLVEQLQRSSMPALRTAQNLTRQAGERVFYGDIKNSLMQRRVTIKMDRSEIWPFDPTRFHLVFDNPALNSCAALDEWEPTWNFGHASDPAIKDSEAFLKENGWSVSHYFPRVETYSVFVEFRHASDGTLLNSQGEKVSVKEVVRVFGPTSKKAVPFVQNSLLWKVIVKGRQNVPALVELLLVLLPALLGLIAGAKDQLLKMDLLPAIVAMWLIGFQSDQIKNLLTQNKKTGGTPASA